MSSDGGTDMRPGELASLATMLPSTQVERRESSQTSSRMLYDVWVHKFGSRLEQNGEESSTTSTGRPLGSQSPSIVWWNTVASYLTREDDSYQERELLQIWQKFEATIVASRLALSPSGDYVAQSHQASVTIRAQEDDYSSVRSKWPLSPHDPQPQRQRLTWNRDGTLLAFSTSDSQLLIFARTGKLLHKLDIKMYQGKETGGVVELAWSKDSAIGTRASQLYVLTYGGILLRYLVYHHDSVDSCILPLSQALELKDDPKRGPLSNLLTVLSYHSVITTMDLSLNGKYLAIGGFGKPVVKASSSAPESQPGQIIHSMTSSVSFWRILDVPPFFEYIAPVDLGILTQEAEEGRKSQIVKKRCFGLWSSPATPSSSSTSRSARSKGKNKGHAKQAPSEAKRPIALIRTVQFSPDSTHLLALDFSGSLTIWDVSKQLPIKRFRSEAVWHLTNGSAIIPSFDHADRIIQAAHWWDSTSIFVLHNCGVCSVFGPVVQPIQPLLSNPRLAALNLSLDASQGSSTNSTALLTAEPSRSVSSSLPSSSYSALPRYLGISASSSSSSLTLSNDNSSGDGKPHLKIVKREYGPAGAEEPQEAKNLLGPLPEKFAPNTIVSRVQNRRIFIFETESNPVKVPRKRLLYHKSEQSKPKRDIDPDLEIPYDYEMEGAKQPSCLKKAALSTWRFFVGHTDDKWGDTTILKSKVTSRLLSLRNTTPEQLLVAKVSAGEYDFALSLANKYKLNPDLIYQTQWRANSVTPESISAFLDKISDRDWVLHECIERIPKTMEAALALLDYGIKIAVPSWMEKGSGSKRTLSASEMEEFQKHLHLATIDSPDDSSSKDIKILLQRLILLSYWDRLQTYALINENKHFDSREFLNFRTCSLVNACATFAQNEDTKALAALWTYHGSVTLPYRLAVLCYLPETLPADSPSVQYLFPSVEEPSDPVLSDTSSSIGTSKADVWPTQQWREKDWVESDLALKALNVLRPREPTDGILEGALQQYAHHCRAMFRGVQQRPDQELIEQYGPNYNEEEHQRRKMFHKLVESIPCEDIFSVRVEKCETQSLDYPLPPEFVEPFHRELVAKDLTKWYKTRAIDIERLSGQADNALALIQVGIKNRVPKLEKVYGKLKLLCSLVYDCGKDTQLKEFEHMDYLRRLHFLLEDSTPSTIVELLNERCEFYLHNAHQIWASYEQEGIPNFSAAFLTSWMCDVARATASNSSSTLGAGMLPHLVQIFRSSARIIAKHQLKPVTSLPSIADTSIPASPSSSSLTSIPSVDERDVASEAIIPTEFMLATLGLHVCYLITPSSKEILDHMKTIHATLPRPLKLPHGPSRLSTDSPSTVATSPSLTSSASSSGSLALEQQTPQEMAMASLRTRVELLGNHLRATEVLLRHDLIKPMELFLTTWRADEPSAISMLFERLLQREIRAQPPLPDSKWRDTLHDLHQLRELLNNSRSLQASAYPSLSASGNAASGTATPSKSQPGLVTPLKFPHSHSPLSVASPSTPIKASILGNSSSPMRPSSPLPSGSGPAGSSQSPGLSVDSTYELFCQALLRAGKFSLAKHYLSELRNSEALVISVAQEYFNSCTSATDKDMQLARDCLALISSPSSQAKEEQKLIDAVVQMSKLEDKFKLSMTDALPIQVRRSHDRMGYLRQLIESQPIVSKQSSDHPIAPTSPRGAAQAGVQNEVYLQLDELIHLGRLLGCASSDSERQEIKLLAANRALKCKDFEYAAKLCQELVDVPSASTKAVWDLAYRISLVEKVDIHARLKFLAFSMRHAPFDALQSMIGLWRGLEMRAKCAEMGVNVEMPRGTPAQLHLTERSHTSSNTPSSVTSNSGMVSSRSQPQLSNALPETSSAALPQFRLDARKVHNAQLIFINTCLSKLMEMNSSKWLHQLQRNAFALSPSQPSLYSFYQPTPYAHPYQKSEAQIRVDPVTGPLATYGDAKVENEIISRIKNLLLRGGNPDTATSRASTIIELSHLAINNGDVNMFMALLLDPEVTPAMARKLFEEIGASSPVEISSALLQLACYYFATLILQSQAHIEQSSFSTASTTEKATMGAEQALFESNIESIIKRAKKLSQQLKAPSTSDIKEGFREAELNELMAHLEYFSAAAMENPVAPAFKVNGANGHASPGKSIMELARQTDIDSLEKALAKLTPEDEKDEFDLMEAHFLALVASDASPKPFLQKFGDELTRSNTFRFEATLDSLWKTMQGETRFHTLRLVLRLQLACAQQHSETLANMNSATNGSSGSDQQRDNPYLTRFPPREHYASSEFVKRLTKQIRAIEDLSKALRSAMTTASSPNASIPSIAWRKFLDGDIAGSLHLIEEALTTNNVEILANSSKQLNELLTTSLHPETEKSSSEPIITPSLIYFTLGRNILKPYEGGKKFKGDMLREELTWFARHLYCNLESRLHPFVEQFLVPRNLDPSLRIHICSQILVYLNDLYEGEEDELVLLLKRLERHLDAILTLSASWSTSASLQTAPIKAHLEYYLNLLDLTFTSPHQDSEIALICSRVVSNGLPIAVAIEIVETYALHRTFEGQPDITAVVNHVIMDALKTIISVMKNAKPSDIDSTPTEPIGIFEWPPTSVHVAHAMLRAMAQSITKSGSSMFYKDVINTLRSELQSSASASETCQLMILRTLQFYPTLYETRRDLLTQDEKMLESFTIKSILQETGEEPRRKNGGEHASEDSSASENAASTRKDKIDPDTLDEKLDVVKRLCTKKSFEKAFQLLLLWSSKAEKDSQASTIAADNDETSAPKTSKVFQVSPSSSVDSGEGEGDGWGFEEEEAEGPLSTNGPSSVPAAPPVQSVNALSSGWKMLFDFIITSGDIKMLLDIRERVNPSWIEEESQVIEIIRLNSDPSNSRILDSWKYGLCTRNASVIASTVSSMREHLAATRAKIDAGSSEEASSVSPLFGFLRGLIHLSSAPSRSSKLRYGTDYDAQLLYILIKSGSFVEFVEDDLMWPLLLEACLFLLRRSLGNQDVQAPSIGSSDYQLVQEQMLRVMSESGDASITPQSIISALIIHAQLSAAALIYFEVSGILPGPTRTLDRFISMLPRLLVQHTEYAKNMASRPATKTSEPLKGAFSQSSGNAFSAALSWSACLDLCQNAQTAFQKLKL